MDSKMGPEGNVYVAGHRGLVGSALVRALADKGYGRLILRTSSEVDLTDSQATNALFAETTPEYVFMAAAKVGGIVANRQYPVDFIEVNLQIQTNIIKAAYKHGVQRLLFLGSSCIYPKLADQPIKEGSLLTGSLESTNRAYALAKIAGVETCWSYNRQYGTRYLAAMPTNLYGPGDNYDLNASHVIPALIQKAHQAKLGGAKELVVWGSGNPKREFLHSDEMAEACVHLMELGDEQFDQLLGGRQRESDNFDPPLVNVGSGKEISIRELAQIVCEVVGFKGVLVFDATKPDGTPRKLMDVSRLRSVGWQSKLSLRDGLAKTYRHCLDTNPHFASGVRVAPNGVSA
jgi:GDP-L-fucose synthase